MLQHSIALLTTVLAAVTVFAYDRISRSTMECGSSDAIKLVQETFTVSEEQRAVAAAHRRAMHASVQSYSTLKAEPNVTFCKANVALGGSTKENAGNTFAQKTYVVTYKVERFFNDKITLIYDPEGI